jgi:hypothetical protein
MEAQDQSFAQVRPLPGGARGHVVAAKAALDALAARESEPAFGWRQGAALTLFAGALGFGVVMGTLRWISVEKGTGWIEAAVPAACAVLVAAATLWPRQRREPAEEARERAAAEARLAALGLAYLAEGRSLAGTSQIVWAHNWQPLDPDDAESFAR